MNKILIVGSMPSVSGIGGVTIHVERLLEYLTKNRISYAFCDYKQAPWMVVLKTILRYDVIHMHPSNPYLRIFLILFSKFFRKKVIFTVHGNLGRYSAFKNFLDKLSVILSDIPILINEESFDKAVAWNKSSILLSAFIPPQKDESLSINLTREIEMARKSEKKIVVTNASARSFTPSGYEIYGIDFLLSFFKDKTEYFLIVSDPSSQYIYRYGAEKYTNVLFVDEPHSFYALMKESDMMIRATITDGDSLSVREGLCAGIKVIATDCVSRPKGTCLFRYNDAESLNLAIQSEQIATHHYEDDSVARLLEIYKMC